jgi:hypothetical protein
MGCTSTHAGPPLGDLRAALLAASGGDRALDARLATDLAAPSMAYTGSVDAAIELVQRVLPGWGWHVGWHADGVTPYATLHDAGRTLHAVAKGPTVPIALLRAMANALAQQAAPAER